MPRARFGCVTDGIPREHDNALIVVDVIRSVTTAVTAVERGFRCFPVRTLDEAFALAGALPSPILAGEVRGGVPAGFDISNSPSAIESHADPTRPVVLLSSSGTGLMSEASAAGPTAYIACLRNRGPVAGAVVRDGLDVSVLAAATRGELRAEDALCSAWILARLAEHGFTLDPGARSLIAAWGGRPTRAVASGKSASYLRGSGNAADLRFILTHIDDVAEPSVVRPSAEFDAPEAARTSVIAALAET
jgi:phosphosulfolactate phosphohydrolase-like enzyme